MIQFEDRQCPVCKTYQAEGLPGIVEEYVRTEDVKLRFAGLAFIGSYFEKALLHVIAAGEQGKLCSSPTSSTRTRGARTKAG